jgi:hypothetical protein
VRTAIFVVIAIVLLLAPVCHAQDWVGLWRESSSGYYFGLRADGELWAFNPFQPSVPPYSLGSFGAGPWAAVSAGFGGPMYALKSNGEIWARGYGGAVTPWLVCSLPPDKQWCALVSEGYDVSAAMTCTGEV